MSENIFVPNVEWKKALRMAFGGRTEAIRTERFRKVYRWRLAPGQPDRADEQIKSYKEHGINDHGVKQWKDFYKDWLRYRRKHQPREAANSKWNKKKAIDRAASRESEPSHSQK